MCYTRGQGCGMRHGGKEMSGHRLLSASPGVRRAVTDGVTPEQAVDEAIARIEQILNDWPRAQNERCLSASRSPAVPC
jgi:hypothetical protein